MTQFDAVYFDGRSAARRSVRVEVADGRLRVTGEGVDVDVDLAQVRHEPPIAGDRHLIHLPGGAQVRTEDVEAIHAVFPPAGHHGAWLRRLESRWTTALGALAFIALAAAWGFFYGLPMAAGVVATRVPDSVSREMGEQTLALLDRGFCAPSNLTDQRQKQVRDAVLMKVVRGLPEWGQYNLELRDCRAIGANALALPDATIVVTDELVRLAPSDDAIAAVLAHEVGHIRNRHPMRLVLQAAGSAALLTSLFNDAASITVLAVAIPTVLLQKGYSREFEDEADGYALERMREVGIPRTLFADMLVRLEESHKNRPEQKGGVGDYLSTHPTTDARVTRANRAP